MNRTLMCFLLGCVVFLGGCGYSTRSVLPANYKRIYVEPFKNKIGYSTDKTYNTYYPLMEVNVRNAIIDRFIFDGALKIAPEDKANLVLSGDLIGYDRSTLRNDDNDNTLEYRIHVTVSMTLRDMEKKEVVWSESGFVGETTYFVSGAQAKTEADAIEDALTDLARRVVERTIEDW